MGAHKIIAIDTEASKLLALCSELSNARDEYREEAYRLREELAASQAWAAQLLSALLVRALNEVEA
jgi:hypothetical protein